MIFDSMEHCEQYICMHEGFQEAFAFIQKAVDEALPAGRYELEGLDIYAVVQEYTTKPESEGKFEGHKKYIDIQYMVSGTEVIYVTDEKHVSPVIAYDETADITFFGDFPEAVKGVLTDGMYGIFFPHDIHKPSLAFGGNPEAVKKIVVKVPYAS